MTITQRVALRRDVLVRRIRGTGPTQRELDMYDAFPDELGEYDDDEEPEVLYHVEYYEPPEH